jgi:hypothetical protein
MKTTKAHMPNLETEFVSLLQELNTHSDRIALNNGDNTWRQVKLSSLNIVGAAGFALARIFARPSKMPRCSFRKPANVLPPGSPRLPRRRALSIAIHFSPGNPSIGPESRYGQ